MTLSTTNFRKRKINVKMQVRNGLKRKSVNKHAEIHKQMKAKQDLHRKTSGEWDMVTAGNRFTRCTSCAFLYSLFANQLIESLINN